MPTDPQIKVRISAKADEFAAATAQIRKDLATLPASAERALKRLDAIAPPPAIERYAQRLAAGGLGTAGLVRRGAGAGAGAAGGFARALPGVGLLAAGVGSAAGFGEMLSRFASGGVELENTARLAGVSTERLNSLRWAARGLGLSAGDADAAMTGLNHVIADAAYGRNATAAALFQRFHIDIGNMRDGAYQAGRVLPQVVDELTRLARVDPRAAERVANMFEIPSSALPLFIQGNQALEAQRQRIERLYGSVGAYVDTSRQFTQATANVGASADKLGMQMFTAAAPALTELLNVLSKLASEHQADISKWITGITQALSTGNFAGAGQMIVGLVGDLGSLTGQTNALTTALEALAATTIGRMLFGGKSPAVPKPPGGFLPWLARLGPLLLTGPAGGQTLGSRDQYGNPIPGRSPSSDRRPDALQPAWNWLGELFHRRHPLPAGPLGGWEAGVPPAPRIIRGDPSLPRGIRNNNPANLEYRPDQAGVVGSDGRFGVYRDMPSGVAAEVRQLQLYQSRGLTTIAQMVEKWAPSSEPGNNTAAYIAAVARDVGIGPNDPVDMRNPELVSRLVQAMSKVENGRPINPRQIRQGVNRALGRDENDGLPQMPGAVSSPATTPQQTGDASNSRVQVVIHHENVPPGVTLRPSVFGNVDLAELRVRQAMPQAGGAAPWTRVG